jgi:hypothetical protein
MCGVIHGDARVQNAILLPDGIVWIDFTSTFVFTEVSVLLENDFRECFKSVFHDEPRPEQIKIYMQCVDKKV